ncbi:MAG TPA: hypothetical protein VMR66_08665 [Gemmatimonadota bacterium]|nr:hypothetical protein [Gemmatimonadota bacterium]
MRAGLLGAAVVLAGCAGGATPPAGSWLHPSFSAGQLQSETVVVLPVGDVVLPAGVLDDSLAAALALRAGDALATALQSRGAAGLAVRPAVAVAALATLSADEIAALYAPLGAALLDASRGGELPPADAAAWRAAAARADARYHLVPRALAIERLEPLRVRAQIDAWLVDGAAATVLWHAVVSAVNPHAPSGAASDVYHAALEDALDAVAGRLAARLAGLARTGADDLEAATP